MTTVLTYGTFDLFHIGHLNLINRLAELGDRLVIGVSTDEFNAGKGKTSVVSYEDRARIIASIKGVDLVIPETSWDQKVSDIKEHDVDVFAIGDDWRGKFDDLKELCEVVYLPRTDGISSTEIKQMLRVLDPQHITEMQEALAVMSRLLEHYRDLT
ncbi:glycerol-3-phosphate cytidylyltransferase [Aeromicrobium sp. SMF47]|uniref:Glycerol-3-phosphate cytidylyltransferase n=1 Tax=Aeromicrobium yanjiei TaxID=2662028 RepID=A0A5Q2MIF0_9ACTN|nr:glycerol-3-phosphate cytidylyltransferase [Aeromicrobium yanjiei]MRJ76388.1 glycerol-3-phosphate cytidylyltransferase [Aeromicrobium yanjiei]MRK00739.1 glycerol-3-phosphate cytidylyltransferase [Aeromicrobium sp. S22]QGG42438.1 glycerol-3-phosphate cytidylyltransferase [Aeromicrobium yanjiei]